MQPQTQAPAPIPKQPLVTLRFQGGPPPPHPPVTEPTPDEEYQMAEAQRQAALAQKQQDREVARSAPAPAGNSGGFFKAVQLVSAAAGKVTAVASNVHAAGEEKVRAMVHQQNQDRFAQNFPELVAAGDLLMSDYTCKAMSQGQKVSGHFQITTRHLCFVGDTHKEAIPLQEIASVQRSVALDTVDNGPPYIMPIPAPHVMPDCLQLFTTQQKVYQFMDFSSTVGKVGSVVSTTIKGRPIDRAYNFLDHAWRGAVQVPLPGVHYAQY